MVYQAPYKSAPLFLPHLALPSRFREYEGVFRLKVYVPAASSHPGLFTGGWSTKKNLTSRVPFPLICTFGGRAQRLARAEAISVHLVEPAAGAAHLNVFGLPRSIRTFGFIRDEELGLVKVNHFTRIFLHSHTQKVPNLDLDSDTTDST